MVAGSVQTQQAVAPPEFVRRGQSRHNRQHLIGNTSGAGTPAYSQIHLHTVARRPRAPFIRLPVGTGNFAQNPPVINPSDDTDSDGLL